MKIAHLLAAAAAGAFAAGACFAQPAPPATEIADAPVSAEEARETALALAGILEESYVFPEIARRYGAALRGKVASGGYDTAGTDLALAELLTADVQAVAPDNHLRVMAGQPGPGGPGPRRVLVRRPGGSGDAGASGAPGPQPATVRMAPPPAMEQPRWLAPGVAFVRFNLFPGDEAVTEAAARFMSDHAEAKTIIFDIRTHRGGGLAEMDAIFPYLFAEPTTLVTMDTRASVERAGGNPIGAGPSMRDVPTDEDVVRRQHFVTPHSSERRLFDAKVYVLTSRFTGSAAEHFALSLKRTHRATLIGETTGGAGNYGGMRRLGEKFSVFVPVGRTFDPDTGKGWEGSGVAPDVAVPAERALAEALVRSGVAAADAERLSTELAPQWPRLRGVPRT